MKKLLPTIFILLATFFCSNIYAQCFSEQTFTTPGQSTFTLPGTAADFHLVEIETKGADGGDFLWSGNPQNNGGEGATIKASYLIPGGSQLLIIVGTSGFDAPGSPGGGGGGGGTAVILDNSDVLIAAAAGGGGGQFPMPGGQGGQANTNSTPIGGAGPGSSGGGGFNSPGGDGPASTGGGAGTLTGQGSGGAGGVTAGSGGAGFGGGGGGSGTVGGGGGGYKGGDGSDGTTDLNGNGGDSYVNSLFSGTVIFNTPGSDGGGANNNGSVTITCIPQGGVEISLVSQTDPDCFNGSEGSIEVTALGGLAPYQYSINGGPLGDSPVFTGLTSGDYTIMVQDGSGSTDMLTVTLTSPPELVGEIVSIIDNICFGASQGSIEITASGGTSSNSTYAYSLNGGSFQSTGSFINLPNGPYTITISDDNSCTTEVNVSITSPDELELVLISKTDITCFGMNDGTCFVDAFGGTEDYLYSIDGGFFGNDPVFLDLMEGSHTIIVQDEEGCTDELTVQINEPDAVSFDLSSSGLVCYDDVDGVISVNNLTGTAPFEFQLNDGMAGPDNVFTGLEAGVYTITVIDDAGCQLMQDIELESADTLILNVTIVSNVECGEDSTGAVILELQNGTGEITYSIDQTSNSSGSFDNLTAGSYTASATDSSGCTAVVDFMILESATFTLSIESVENASCFGISDGSFTIAIDGANEPIQYSLDGTTFQASPTFEDLAVGDYNVQVTDSSGCVNSIDVSITEPTQLQISYLTVQNVECYGDDIGSISLSVTGGTPAYILNSISPFEEDDTISLSSLVAGQYALIITDTSGCVLNDTISIFQNDSLQLFPSIIIADSCGIGSTGFIDLNATGGYAPLIISLEGDSNMTGEFDNLVAGTYTAGVVDTFGCMTSLDITIPSIGALVIDSLAMGNVSCHGLSDGFIDVFISNYQGSISYYLNDILYTDSAFNNLSGGVYEFVAIDEQGCSVAIEVEITEPDPLTIDLLEVNFVEGCLTVEANGGTKPYRYSIDDKATFQDSSKFVELESGDYSIIVIDDNGCENTYFYILDNIAELSFPGLNVFPNPVRNTLFVHFENVHTEVAIEIIDRTGKVVKKHSSENLRLIDNNIEISVDGIFSGSYFLKISTENAVVYRKIIIIN
jgi:hypothetical protein